jgi:hypothetical protein
MFYWDGSAKAGPGVGLGRRIEAGYRAGAGRYRAGARRISGMFDERGSLG